MHSTAPLFAPIGKVQGGGFLCEGMMKEGF